MSSTEYPISSYDLHLHTCWSFDATAEPESYFKRAAELGVTCIAITEHHGLDSLPEITAISNTYPGIRAIPSAELTVTTSIGPVDLLCYGFCTPFSEDMNKLLRIYHVWQQETGNALWKGMQSLGYDFCESQLAELLASYRPPRTLAVQGHTHVKYQFLRQYFIDRGFISQADEFQNMLNRAAKAASSPPYPDVDEIIPVVRASRAVVAIAHPLHYFNKDDERRMDTLRVECALDGIECAHTRSIPPEYGAAYRKYCRKHSLFSVGGSDCHGDQGDLENRFARHGGKDEWLDEFLERITIQ